MGQQQDIDRNNICDCINRSIKENMCQLEELRAKRRVCLGNGNPEKPMDPAYFNSIILAISQIENENAGLEAKLRKQNSDQTQNIQSLDNNQTVISTSSVRRKDQFALNREKNAYKDQTKSLNN